MTFCTNCGAQNQDNTEFCTACGARLTTSGASSPTQPGLPPSHPGPPVQSGVTYAVWADRVIGYLIDQLLVGAGMLILYLVMGSFFAMLAGMGSQFAGG